MDAVYVNHKIRDKAELENEVALNVKNAEKLGVRLTVVELQEGEVERLSKDLGLEGAARELRYKALYQNCEDLICTAHTASDQIETLMMRLITGCSLKALGGIREINGRLVRPLLSLTREDTVSYCKTQGLEFSVDTTNYSFFALRNRVRYLVAPRLSEAERQSLLNISKHIREAEARAERLEIKDHKTYLSISRGAYLASSALSRLHVLYELYARFDALNVSFSMIKALGAAILNRKSYEDRALFMKAVADELRFYFPKPYFVSAFEDARLPFGLKLVQKHDGKALKIEKNMLEGNAIFRISEEGDEITLVEGKKSVSSLLSSWKCPYAVVLQDKEGIAAVFASAFGGRDRVAKRLLSKYEGEGLLLT